MLKTKQILSPHPSTKIIPDYKVFFYAGHVCIITFSVLQERGNDHGKPDGKHIRFDSKH